MAKQYHFTTRPWGTLYNIIQYVLPGRGYLSGDTSAMGDVGESPGESCLFSLTPSADPGIGLSGDSINDLYVWILELDYWNGLELE